KRNRFSDLFESIPTHKQQNHSALSVLNLIWFKQELHLRLHACRTEMAHLSFAPFAQSPVAGVSSTELESILFASRRPRGKEKRSLWFVEELERLSPKPSKTMG